MCGIAGLIAKPKSSELDTSLVERVNGQLQHRGPDGQGCWTSSSRRVAFAHRRLAIIDTTNAGAQPMSTTDGRLTVVFNGEIYNYASLKAELSALGTQFRSNSDTEVLLELYRALGPQMTSRLRGMFAFAIYDHANNSVFLARDHFGIKPLYVAETEEYWAFASEVKALRVLPGLNLSLSPVGLVGFLVLGSVPEPATIFNEVRLVEAGTSVCVDVANGTQKEKRYYRLRDEISLVESSLPQFSPHQSAEYIANYIHESICAHMVADVPVGAFMSAGLDSNAIVSTLARQTNSPLTAITIGFEEFRGQSRDEVPLASAGAQLSGATHHVRSYSSAEFQSLLSRFRQSMDQPTLDGVNCYLASIAAKECRLKVVMSGIGGDELLGGYPSFNQIPRLAGFIRLLGPLFNSAIAAATLMKSIGLLRHIHPKYAALPSLSSTVGGLYYLKRGLYMPNEIRELIGIEMFEYGWKNLLLLDRLNDDVASIRSHYLKVMCLEFNWYLKNQLLRDADWTGMSQSVEIRVPFVDVDLVRSALRYSAAIQKIRKLPISWLVPEPHRSRIQARTKTGFETPLFMAPITDNAPSLRRGIRSWALDCLNSYALSSALPSPLQTRQPMTQIAGE